MKAQQVSENPTFGQVQAETELMRPYITAAIPQSHGVTTTCVGHLLENARLVATHSTLE